MDIDNIISSMKLHELDKYSFDDFYLDIMNMFRKDNGFNLYVIPKKKSPLDYGILKVKDVKMSESEYISYIAVFFDKWADMWGYMPGTKPMKFAMNDKALYIADRDDSYRRLYVSLPSQIFIH